MDEDTISNVEAVAVEQLTEEELAEALEIAEDELRKQEAARREALDSLASEITGKYQTRQGRRAIKEQQWLHAQSLILNSLGVQNPFYGSPDRPFDERRTNNRPDKNIVRTKCDIALAQVMSSQFAGGEKNWDLLPPDEIPPEIPDIADRCERMEHTIANQLEECDYMTEAYKVATQWVSLGTGVMKGPVNYGKTKKTYVPEIGQDGRTIWVPKITQEYKPYLCFVDIWKYYPDDTSCNGNEAEDAIEVHTMSSLELQRLRENPGFLQEVIDEVLILGPSKEATGSYSHAASVSDSNSNKFKNKYEVLEYHGPISRTTLDKLEIEPSYEMPGDMYFGEVWVVHNRVIRIELESLEGTHKPPYSMLNWLQDPSSPFGYGVAIMLKDHQRVVSESWHMILDNASASSAPQIVINQDMIEPADGSYEISPAKIWYFTDISGKVSDAFQQFEITNTTEPVHAVLQMAIQAAEEESGIPMMLAGLKSPEVGTDSATGMAIEQHASTTLLDYKSGEWDRYITNPRFRAMYDWNMQYNLDDSIKAPMELRIRPATEYRNKQKHIRDMEKLIVQASQNPALGTHINMGELVRAQLGMMTLPTRSIVKSAEQVQAEEQQKAQNPPPPSPDEIKAQVDMARLELERERLALEREKLSFEFGANQQREAWEHEERLANTYARVAEAEGQVVKSQNEKEMRLLELAAKAENEKEKSRLSAGIAVRNDETHRYLKGLDHTAKVRDQLIKMDETKAYREEMRLKAEKGEGV